MSFWSDISIPYLCEGEILSVMDNPSEDDVMSGALDAGSGGAIKMRPVVLYVCRVSLTDGGEIIVPNVMDSSMFGGIDDYFQIRRRASNDATTFTGLQSGENSRARIGDRVLIAFINGHFARPVIVTGLQHPLQVPRFEEGTGPDTNPQMFLRYLGVSMVVDELGQMTVSHYGAPKIKYTGTQGISELGGAVLGAAVGSVSGSSSGYGEYEEGDLPNDEADSDAVEPRDYTVKTTYEFLDNGTFRLRDSVKQNITIDPESGTIEITNNGLSSTQPADGGGLLSSALGSGSGEDAEVIRFDQTEQSIFINSRKLTSIISGGDRVDETTGDYTKTVEGNEDITVSGDQSESIDGSATREINGDFEDSIYGASTTNVTGDVQFDTKGTYSLTTVGDMTIDTKGNISVSAVGDGAYDFKGAFDMTIVGDYSVSSNGNIVLSSVGDITISDSMGGGLNISKGKVEIGGAATGIFASVLEIEAQLEALIDAITQATYPTGTGPSGPAINTPAFIQVKTQLMAIKTKLNSVTGSL